jgi:hypothetical protein
MKSIVTVAVKSANAVATKSLMIMMQQEATRIRPIVTLAVIINNVRREDQSYHWQNMNKQRPENSVTEMKMN